MKAVLMAAGVGSRIKEINRPKSLLDIGGISIIRHTVELLLSHNIPVAIITGYKGDMIHKELQDYQVTFYDNPFYRVTNSIASLWFAKDFLSGDDIILANADVYWDDYMLNKLIGSPHPITMLTDNSKVKEGLGDYFFRIDDKNHVYGFGKDIVLNQRDTEYIGIAKIIKEFVPTFVLRMQDLVFKEEYNLWWENVLYTHCQESPIFAMDVEGHEWSEVDSIEDYQRLCAIYKKMTNE